MGEDGKGKPDPKKLPSQPLHLAWARQMDFSPMHPDDWAATDAGRWHYFLQIRQEFEDAREELKSNRKRKSEIDKKTKEYHAKHQGAAF